MEKEIESVERDCKHPDCIYRKALRGGLIPFCGYALEEGQSRGCKISECDKYKAGRRVKAKMHSLAFIEWEKELYGGTTDNPNRERHEEGERR